MLHITEHQYSKMCGMVSINTSSLHNAFCRKMSKIEDTVCQSCYARRLEKFYPAASKCFFQNGQILVGEVGNIPRLNRAYIRFHSFGELMNEVHYHNFVAIAEHNPETRFGLWTKRPELVDVDAKPHNLILVHSSPYLNRPAELPTGFDKVYTVYDHYTDIDINCVGKCIDCQMCYTRNSVVYISEVLRK